MGSLWGITADGWLAIATLCSALAILVGGIAVFWQVARAREQLIEEQEARDVRRQMFDEGALAMREGLENVLEVTRLNYALMLRVLMHVQKTKGSRSAALRMDLLPNPMREVPKLNTRAIGLTAVLIGTPKLGELMTHAFANLYSLNLNFEIGIRHQLLKHYTDDGEAEDISDWARTTENDARDQYLMADQSYLPISPLLLQAVQLAQRNRLRRFADITAIRESPEMRSIAQEIERILETSSKRYESFLAQ